MANKPLVDLRIYTIALRKIPEFLEIFDTLAMPVQLRHLNPPIGFHVSHFGPLNQVVHLWEYDDLADMERRWNARDADPDWPAYLKASGHLIVAQENRILKRAVLPSMMGPSMKGVFADV